MKSADCQCRVGSVVVSSGRLFKESYVVASTDSDGGDKKKQQKQWIVFLSILWSMKKTMKKFRWSKGKKLKEAKVGHCS